MKISFKSLEVTFASINSGECFAIDGNVYIKTQPYHKYDSSAFGCCLDNGILRNFKDGDYVHPINMEVIEV